MTTIRHGEAMVRLSCGTEVSNYSEAWRMECYAAHLLDRYQLVARRAYLEAYRVKHGDAAYLVLRDTLVAVHAARKAARPPAPAED